MSGIADAQNTKENTKINVFFSQRPVKINILNLRKKITTSVKDIFAKTH